MNPDYINPLQWHEALGVARQSCARVFRDGGAPADALRAFGLTEDGAEKVQQTWDKVVVRIAQELCAKPIRRAA